MVGMRVPPIHESSVDNKWSSDYCIVDKVLAYSSGACNADKAPEPADSWDLWSNSYDKKTNGYSSSGGRVILDSSGGRVIPEGRVIPDDCDKKKSNRSNSGQHHRKRRRRNERFLASSMLSGSTFLGSICEVEEPFSKDCTSLTGTGGRAKQALVKSKLANSVTASNASDSTESSTEEVDAEEEGEEAKEEEKQDKERSATSTPDQPRPDRLHPAPCACAHAWKHSTEASTEVASNNEDFPVLVAGSPPGADVTENLLLEASMQLQHQKGARGGKSKKLPNYFLAFRVRNKKTHRMVKKVQEEMSRHTPDLSHTFIDTSTLHVTLAVMTIPSQQEIDKAIQVVHDCEEKIGELNEKYEDADLEIAFKWLGNFKNHVVYAYLEENEAFQYVSDLAEIFREAFLEAGIQHVRGQEFRPHLTVAKMSKNVKKLKQLGLKKIPEESYIKYRYSTFGSEQLSSIVFCSMMDRKAEDGFYSVLSSLQLFIDDEDDDGDDNEDDDQTNDDTMTTEVCDPTADTTNWDLVTSIEAWEANIKVDLEAERRDELMDTTCVIL